jgi:hypothetical protein
MEYTALEEAGLLEIEYEGGPIDTHFIATIHLELQEIFDKVAWAELDGQYLRDIPLPRWYWRRHGYPDLPVDRFIRAEIKDLKVGSLFETFAFLAPAFLQPDIRSILQNLVASIIYQVGASRIGGVRSNDKQPKDRPPAPSLRCLMLEPMSRTSFPSLLPTEEEHFVLNIEATREKLPRYTSTFLAARKCLASRLQPTSAEKLAGG